jgi:hypothetical protein
MSSQIVSSASITADIETRMAEDPENSETDVEKNTVEDPEKPELDNEILSTDETDIEDDEPQVTCAKCFNTSGNRSPTFCPQCELSERLDGNSGYIPTVNCALVRHPVVSKSDVLFQQISSVAWLPTAQDSSGPSEEFGNCEDPRDVEYFADTEGEEE